jgi:hypothetical protein
MQKVTLNEKGFQVEEVKHLNHKGFRRPILDILEDLAKPIPARFIKKKPVFSRQNGKLVKTGEVDYVSWSIYIKLLDFGNSNQ